MFIYIANQLNLMYTKSEWNVSQQTISATKEAMQILHTFRDHRYSNISVGIQLKPKAKVVEEPEALDADAHKIQRYLTIHGNFESYQNQTYGPFNTSVNQNLSDWKPYENNLTTN